jgi:hypothetical protein
MNEVGQDRGAQKQRSKSASDVRMQDEFGGVKASHSNSCSLPETPQRRRERFEAMVDIGFAFVMGMLFGATFIVVGLMWSA